MHTLNDKKLLMLRPEEIRTNSNYTREYNEYELKLLSCSIATIGVIEPILIRRDQEGNYILVSGGRRLKAAMMAGLRRIPCVLHKIDSHTSAIFSVAENLQRKNLPFFDEAKAISSLINELGFSHSETSATLGIPQ
ncbi:MAG: ParB/RepB/Spo0J family partition protein, partial [Clostridia bacterium]|nr:ParB/RepB/Spo0J family partition protein [Clostridia bacterium]